MREQVGGNRVLGGRAERKVVIKEGLQEEVAFYLAAEGKNLSVNREDLKFKVI